MKIEEINNVIGSCIDSECKNYAIEKMPKDSYLLAMDAKENNEIVFINEGKLKTIKQSRMHEFNHYYMERFEEIIVKIVTKDEMKERKICQKTIWQSLKTLMGKNIW